MVSGGWLSAWEKTGKTGNAMAKARPAQKSRTDTRHPLVLQIRALTTPAERNRTDWFLNTVVSDVALYRQSLLVDICGSAPSVNAGASWCGYLNMIGLGHILVIHGSSLSCGNKAGASPISSPQAQKGHDGEAR
jgi:hypothetical protein